MDSLLMSGCLVCTCSLVRVVYHHEQHRSSAYALMPNICNMSSGHQLRRSAADFATALLRRPGMYMFISVPSISVMEWHPFSKCWLTLWQQVPNSMSAFTALHGLHLRNTDAEDVSSRIIGLPD